MREKAQESCRKCERYEPKKGKRLSPRCRANCANHPDNCPLWSKTVKSASICDVCPNRYDDVCDVCQHKED